MGNEPVSGVDPDGRDCPDCPNDKRFDVYRNNSAMFGYDPEIGAYSYGVTVTGQVTWFDNFIKGVTYLDERFGGTHGYEFMNSGPGGTLIYLQRKGKSLGIIVDPAEGLVVFKHNGYKFKIDNKTTETSTAYKKFLEMLSDSKFVAVDLRGSTDKVIKLVEDQIINNHGLLKVEQLQYEYDTASKANLNKSSHMYFKGTEYSDTLIIKRYWESAGTLSATDSIFIYVK